MWDIFHGPHYVCASSEDGNWQLQDMLHVPLNRNENSIHGLEPPMNESSRVSFTNPLQNEMIHIFNNAICILPHKMLVMKMELYVIGSLLSIHLAFAGTPW